MIEMAFAHSIFFLNEIDMDLWICSRNELLPILIWPLFSPSRSWRQKFMHFTASTGQAENKATIKDAQDAQKAIAQATAALDSFYSGQETCWTLWVMCSIVYWLCSYLFVFVFASKNVKHWSHETQRKHPIQFMDGQFGRTTPIYKTLVKLKLYIQQIETVNSTVNPHTLSLLSGAFTF